MRVDSIGICGYEYADADMRIQIPNTDTRIGIRGYGYADTDMRIRIRGYGYADTDTRIRMRGYGSVFEMRLRYVRGAFGKGT